MWSTAEFNLLKDVSWKGINHSDTLLLPLPEAPVLLWHLCFSTMKSLSFAFTVLQNVVLGLSHQRFNKVDVTLSDSGCILKVFAVLSAGRDELKGQEALSVISLHLRGVSAEALSEADSCRAPPICPPSVPALCRRVCVLFAVTIV